MEFPRIFRVRVTRGVVAALACFGLAAGSWANSDVTVKGGLSKGGRYTGLNPKVFTPTKPLATAGVGTVKTHLNAGRSVTVTTASTQVGNGDLSVIVEVAKTGRRASTLALSAERDLIISKPLRSTKSPLSVELKAGRAITLTAPITTFGGNLSIFTVEPFVPTTTLTAGGGKIILQGGTMESALPQTLTAARVDVETGGTLMLTGGVTGDLSVAGKFSPGAQGLSNFQVAGNVTLQPTATTAVNLAGVAKAGKLIAQGAVTLDGALRVDCLEGFEDLIVPSHSFTIITGSSISGTFTGVGNGERVMLPDELGSMKVTYTATSVTLSDWQPIIINLTWDPGTDDAGTNVFTNDRIRGRRHYFRVHTEVTDIGAWRTRLTTPLDGEADLYMRRGALPSVGSYEHKSTRIGADGFVLNKDQFSAGQEWLLLVYADVAKAWSILSGRAFVQDLGTLPWNDLDTDGSYQIGEPPLSHGSGPVAIYGEGMRFFKATLPSGTPAWSLWLNGSNKSLAVRRNTVPFQSSQVYYDRKQNGQLLIVPPVLGSGVTNYFASVVGNPGEEINLDSRIQEVTDVPFDSLVENVDVPGVPYRVYRVQVPLEQIAWDVSTIPHAGDANIAIRRGMVAAEYDNDAFSEVAGQVRDSVTLVPNFLSDGAWYITIYGGSPYRFTMRNGPPVITPINFTDVKVNDEPLRAGWKFFALSDIEVQLGAYGWMLELANQVPGTEIALRRNAVPSRWRNRKDGFPMIYESSVVEYSGKRGFLERPAHQPDVWYAGIYFPTEALGEFTLSARPIQPPAIAFDGGTRQVTDLEPGRWAFVRVVVPPDVKGWDARVRNVTGAVPVMAIRHDLLPEVFGTLPINHIPSGWTPSRVSSWPTGNQWKGTLDWTGHATEADGTAAPPGIVAAMGRPLEPGSYYIGVLNTSLTETSTFTIESRGIGAGQSCTIANLAYDGGTGSIANLPPREARYFKTTVPPNTPSWEVIVDATLGDVQLEARREFIPDFNAGPLHSIYRIDHEGEQTEVRKLGQERYVLLPPPSSANLIPGDYYLTVVSEGVNPSSPTIGTGTSNAQIRSAGPLGIEQMGTATPSGISRPVTLVAGQIKAFHFNVAPDTNALECRLLDSIGAPIMTVLPGPALPTPEIPSEHAVYGIDGGILSVSSTALITAPNPSTGVWSVLVHAPPTMDASATLHIVSHGPLPIAFDGGLAHVTEHLPGTWRYFTIQVPPGAMGWDFRVRGVVGTNLPLMIRRDSMPTLDSENQPTYVPSSWRPHTSLEWLPGWQWLATLKDWTGYSTDATGAVVPDRIVSGMGRPLQPGTYYAGVYNKTALPAAYTVDSRGIGLGLTYPVPDLAYAGGSAQVANLAPREARYFRVVVPPNSPSWEVVLTPVVGEVLLAARYQSIPDFLSVQDGSVYETSPYGAEVRMKKVGGERYVLVPNTGANFLPEGDYYLAVVSEGVGPSGSSSGIGDCEAQLTSVGPLAVKDLGIPSAEGTREPVTLEAGQIRAYQVTVPPNTLSLEARLDDPIGNPQISLVQGTKLPRPAALGQNIKYGWNSGVHGVAHNSIITAANPAEGTWTILVRGGQPSQAQTFGPSSATLVVTALSTVPLNFDGGSHTVVNQQAGSWRYFVVEVPAGPLGWDVRLRAVNGAIPALLVRRDEMPFCPPPANVPANFPPSWAPSSSTTWPTTNQWWGTVDWTSYLNKVGDPSGPPGLVAAMGRPLEPGTYYIGVYNNTLLPTGYTIGSRGIGEGMHYQVTELPFAGGSGEIADLLPREPKYFKVTIPAATQSWEFSVGTTLGDLQVALRRDYVPDFTALAAGTIYNSNVPQLKLRKAGAERYLLLSDNANDIIPAGDYYIAVVSDGVNPNRSTNVVGTSSSSGTVTSHGALPITDLGSVTAVGESEAVSLVSTQSKAYRFEVPVGTDTLEVRLENTIGFPEMMIAPGTRLPAPPIASPYGGTNGGGTGTFASRIHSVINPKPGPWTVMARATDSGQPEPDLYPDASATLVVRQKPNVPLNFDAAQNGNGLSETDARQVINSEYTVYKVTPPATLAGQPVLGWVIRTELLQGAATVRVFKDFANPSSGIERPAGTMIVVPPFLTFDEPWYVLVRATGTTQFRITSRALTLERPVWSMPAEHNLIFGDSGFEADGNPLPGDRGVDLKQGDWHFYSIDVPANNQGLLRTELQAISGNPDLYLREDGVPTTDHFSNGPSGTSLIHRTLTGATTSYGNWVPINGRSENRLRPGRWFLGVRAGSNSNVRYRLIASTGNVRDLTMDASTATAQVPSEVTSQALADNDWRYYRFTVPEAAPKDWTLTFAQNVGDVVMRIRDTVPPGQKTLNTTLVNDVADAASDAKNQGPYLGACDFPGEYAMTTPPLRPGHVYYVGFRSNNSATFSFSSRANAGTITLAPILNFYTGSVSTTIPANSSIAYRIPAPPEATRMKFSAVHSAAVSIRMEQGTLTGLTGPQHLVATGVNTIRSLAFSNTTWPWQAAQTYYVRFVNGSGAAENITFTLNGKNAQTDDEDADGLPDAWEIQAFGNVGQSGLQDTDGDGVSNAVEFADGTLPNNVNSAKYTLTVLAKNGTAAIDPIQEKYDRGATVTVSSTAAPGYDFITWSGGPFRTDDFALKASGTITIPTTGVWTFGIHTGDGARLLINGATVISDPNAHEPAARFAQISLAAGTYPIELVAFERLGGECLELFAAPGSFTSIQPEFRLVGDVTNGGLAVQTTVDGIITPGFLVRQVALLSGAMTGLPVADNALAGTTPNRLERAGLIDTINFADFSIYDGYFADSAYFPLSTEKEDQPLQLTMGGNYVLTAIHSLSLGVGLDAEALPWETGGNVPWLAENDATAFDGVDLAITPALGDNQSATLQTTVEGPGILTFRWKVSSAVGDWFYVYLDGVSQGFIYGETAWALRTINIPAGVHRVSWIYSKNPTGSAGSDRAYIDQVTFTK